MVTYEAKDRISQPDPVLSELLPVHRYLYAPSYVPDHTVAKEIDANVRKHRLNEDTGQLRLDYLYKLLNVEASPAQGMSWGRLFGNFMGTVAAFGTLLETARTNQSGFVTETDSISIMRIVRSLQEYRGALGTVMDEENIDVFSAMRMSAAFCSKVIDDLHGLFLMPERPLFQGRIEEENIREWLEGRCKLSTLEKGAAILFTDVGLKALRGWVAKAAHPMRFIDEGLPHDVVLGAGEMHLTVSRAEIDPFSSVNKLPHPHPSYAPAVNRALVELVGIAKSNGIPVLQARWNGWRRSVDLRVHTDHVDGFLELVRLNEEMGSLRGSHNWWIERLGKQASIVIPTQPSIHVKRFEDLTEPLWEKVRAMDEHLRGFDLSSEKKIDLDLGKLDSLLELMNQLANMRNYLSKEMEEDPHARTQERYTVHEWITRLEHVMKPYSLLQKYLRQEGVLRYQIQQCLDSQTFSLLEHIPATAHRWTIPRTQIDLPDPRPEVIPRKWLEAHKLITRLYLFATEVAGAFEESSAHPVHVKAIVTFDKPASRIVVLNDDGRLVQSLAHIDPEGRGHLIPSLTREIFDLSKIVAPQGEKLSIDVEKNVIFIPIELASRGEPEVPGGSTDEMLRSRYPGLFGGIGGPLSVSAGGAYSVFR